MFFYIIHTVTTIVEQNRDIIDTTHTFTKMRILAVSEEKAIANFEADCRAKEQIMMDKNAPQSICTKLFRTPADVDFTLSDNAYSYDDEHISMRKNATMLMRRDLHI